MKKILQFTCFSALLISATAMGQDDAPEPPTLYQVEVLVFKHLDQSRTSEEIPRLAELQIEDVLDQQLAQMSAQSDIETEMPTNAFDEAESALFWSVAPEGTLNMDRDAARLQKLQAYDVLAHLAWVQPAIDVAMADEIEVSDLGAGGGITGTLRFYQKKYLHLAVNLALDDSAAESFTGGQFPQMLPVNQTRPSIADSRRIRLGRTVYFDQPKFGVLATVYRTEVSAPE